MKYLFIILIGPACTIALSIGLRAVFGLELWASILIPALVFGLLSGLIAAND